MSVVVYGYDLTDADRLASELAWAWGAMPGRPAVQFDRLGSNRRQTGTDWDLSIRRRNQLRTVD
jgi:hypothetical protein